MKHNFISVAALLFLFGSDLMAFDYFSGDIDFWKKPKKENTISQEKVESSGEDIVKKDDNKKAAFDWNKHLDPKNEEFFKEGDYTPPAAFMELARNPTDQNIKNWFKLIERKNELSTRLSDRVKDYLKKNRKITPEEKLITENAVEFLPQSAKDYSRFKFRMYFESNCPHCKRMMATMKDLRDMGYFVELKQIDKNPKITDALPFPVTQATKKELKEKNINSWPVLFIGDLKEKVVYRLNGYRSTSDVISAIQTR